MKQILRKDKVLIRFVYAIIVVAILVAAVFVISRKTNQSKVFLGGQEISVVIANTPLLQEQGLSGQRMLADNKGMLFVFDSPQQTGFWMKDMLFPIDIIWFDEQRRIIDVWANAQPDSYPHIVSPHGPAKFVLEVPAGFFMKYKLKLGNTIEFAL